MFFSGCYQVPVFTRSIGIARTNSLDICDAYDSENPNFWVTDENPVLPLSDNIENTSALVYDGSEDDSLGHLNRQIGLAYISLPLEPGNFK